MKYLAILVMFCCSNSFASPSESEKQAAAEVVKRIAKESQMRIAKNPDTYYLYGMATLVSGRTTQTEFMFDNKEECLTYIKNWKVVRSSSTYPLTYQCIQREDTRPKYKVVNQ